MAKRSSQSLNDSAQIPFLDILEGLGIPKISSGSENEFKVICPFHEDKNPSLHFNINKGAWHCKNPTCRKGRTLASLLSGITGRTTEDILDEWKSLYPNAFSINPVNPQVIAKEHIELLKFLEDPVNSKSNLKKALDKRGITTDVVQYGSLGMHMSGDGIKIPVFLPSGIATNVRIYRPDVSGRRKFENMKGRGEPLLYNSKDLKHDIVWACGGEMKALVPSYMFSEAGEDIGCISWTCGEPNFEASWAPRFKDKVVYICMDADTVGFASASRTAELISSYAKAVYIIRLPFSPDQNLNDLSDYIVANKCNVEDLKILMNSALEYQKGQEVTIEAPSFDSVRKTPITELRSLEGNYVPVKFDGQMVGMLYDQVTKRPESTLPTSVRVRCSMQHPDSICEFCAIKRGSLGTLIKEGPHKDKLFNSDIKVNIHSPEITKYFGVPGKRRITEILNEAGIPKDCSIKQIDETGSSYAQAYKVFIEEPDTDSNDDTGNNTVEAIVLESDTCETSSFSSGAQTTFSGYLYVDETTGARNVYILEAGDSSNNLDSVSFSDGDIEDMEVFQPRSWEAVEVEDKLYSIANSLVDRFGFTRFRADLALIVDLTYHSVLKIPTLGGKGADIRGWINTFIIGDTSTGKTTLSNQIRAFYGLGGLATGKNSSGVGLTISLEQSGGAWKFRLGPYVKHDRGLFILDEAKGLDVNQLKTLTSARSEGYVKVDKVISTSRKTRTRTIFITNPRQDDLAYNHYGIVDVQEFWGDPEELRRVDICLGVKENEGIRTYSVEPTSFDAEVAKNLILKCWSLKATDILVKPGFSEALEKETKKLCDKYQSDLKLVESYQSFITTMQRLCCAVAGRLNSFDLEGRMILRPSFPVVVAKILDRFYTCPTLQYDKHAIDYKERNNFEPEKAVTAMRGIATANGIPPRELIRLLKQRPKASFLRSSNDERNWISSAISCGMMVLEGDKISASRQFLNHLSKNPKLLNPTKAATSSSEYSSNLPDTPL